MSASPIGGFYRRVRGTRESEDKGIEVEFYRALLRGFKQGDTVFDIGANTGEKADTFVRLGARVVAVEPDELNLKRLRSRFIRLQGRRVPVSIIGAAVSDREGSETMWVDGPGSALNTLSRKWADTLKGDKSRFAHTIDALEFKHEKSVTTTTLDRLIQENGTPFFVKIGPGIQGRGIAVH
jgi:FkbM family methyltransferase